MVQSELCKTRIQRLIIVIMVMLANHDDDHARSQFFGKSAICLFVICYCLTAAFDNGDDDDNKGRVRIIKMEI